MFDWLCFSFIINVILFVISILIIEKFLFLLGNDWNIIVVVGGIVFLIV